MLTELCQELRNWFDLDRRFGTFTISGGTLTADFLQTNQYYRIVGSVFNDGVHKYGDETDELTDETFDGAVWALAIPKEVVALANDIDEWQTKYGGADSAALSPFNSESFGGYSYSKGSGASSNSDTSNSGWQAAYASRLNKWRKI